MIKTLVVTPVTPSYHLQKSINATLTKTLTQIIKAIISSVKSANDFMNSGKENMENSIDSIDRFYRGIF